MTPPKALHAAIAVFFLYWGNLVLSSLLNPGYSNMRQQVSELGANAASHPMIFNGLILATGVAQLVGACGYYQALRRLAVGPSLSGLPALVLTLFGVAVLMSSRSNSVPAASRESQRCLSMDPYTQESRIIAGSST